MTAPEQPVLAVRNLTAGYGRLPILHGVSFTVGAGEIVTLIGPNGSGKSTLLKAACGLADVHDGQVVFDGRDIVRQETEVTVRAGLAYVPQRENVFPELTVAENLELGTHARSDWPQALREFDRVYDLFPVLADRHRQKAGTLSGGERQMLAVGRALIGNPKIMLLDEPSAALSPKLVEEIFDTVQQIAADGTAILLAEQNASQALLMSNRAFVLISGEIAFEGSGREIMDSSEVQERVLGRGGGSNGKH